MSPKDVLQALGQPVKYEGGNYTMTAYILRQSGGRVIHQAELLDPCGHSVTIAQLEKCERSADEK